MGYLLNVTENYRFSNDEAAKTYLEELKKDPTFEVAKYGIIKKCAKQKGEIVDEWVRLSVMKKFNDEKEPDCSYEVIYKRA